METIDSLLNTALQKYKVKTYAELHAIANSEKENVESFEVSSSNTNYQLEVSVTLEDTEKGLIRVEAAAYADKRVWWRRLFSVSQTAKGFIISSDGTIESY